MNESLIGIEENISHSQNFKNHILQTWENTYKWKDLMCVGKSKYNNHVGSHSQEFVGEIYMYYKTGTVVKCMRLKTKKPTCLESK